eukprot:685796-Amphidinium_carterae.1
MRDIAIDAAGDLHILDNGDENVGRVVRVREGVGQVVGDVALALHCPFAMCIGGDGGLYVLDAGGSRVQRYAGGVTTVVA